jgi:hypothetical protein
MATIQTEVWSPNIQEQLFPNNSFVDRCVNMDAWVQPDGYAGYIVNVPQSGASVNVVKNRTQFPVPATLRSDTNRTMQMDEYSSEMIRLPRADQKFLSYDKRSSIVRGSANKMGNEMAIDIMQAWAADTAARFRRTTGTAVSAALYNNAWSGNRAPLTLADIMATKRLLDKDEVPGDDNKRYMMIVPELEADLIAIANQIQFGAFDTPTLTEGRVTRLLGFNVIVRSSTPLYNGSSGSPALKAIGAAPVAATDAFAALVWHSDFVGRAMADVEIFENDRDAGYQGDTFSFVGYCKAMKMRENNVGVAAIIQAAS